MKIFSLSADMPVVWNVPIQNQHFLGRDQVLQNLSDTLKNDFICVLNGGAGFGKSQTAKQFAYLNSQFYDVIYWFRADQPLAKPFEKFAEDLNLLLQPSEQIFIERLSSEKLLDEVKDLLRRKSWRVLLIFDGVKDFEALTPYLPVFRKGLHIIFTTQAQNTAYPMIKVDKFSRNESIQFIKQMLPYLCEADLMKIVAYCLDHPLALATTASFLLSHPSVSIAQYTASHALQREAIPLGLFVDQYAHNLDTSLRITIKTLSKDSPEACQILKFLTLLHHENIPFSYIQSFIKKTASRKTADQVISILYGQSLLTVSQNNDTPNVRFSIHELVHTLICKQILPNDKIKLLKQSIPVVAEPFRGRSDVIASRILKSPEYFFHAQKLSEVAKEMNYHSIPLLSLRIRMLDVTSEWIPNLKIAQQIIEDIKIDLKNLYAYQEDFLELALTPEFLSPIDQAILEMNLGYFERVFFLNYKKSFRHDTKALEILEKLSGEYEEKLRVIKGLATSCVYMGKLKDAKNFIEEGKKLLKKSKSESTDFFFMRVALYGWHMSRGEYGKAFETLKNCDRFLRNSDRVSDEISLMLRKAYTLAKMGQHKKSRLFAEKAQKSIYDFLGNIKSKYLGFLKMIEAFNYIGTSTHLEEANLLIQEALDVFENVFHGGKKHLLQGWTYFLLGQLYEKKGDLQKAQKAYLKSEAIYDTVLQGNAIDDVSRLYTSFAILGFKLRDQQIAQNYLRKSIAVFGLNYPGTLKIVKYALDRHWDVPY